MVEIKTDEALALMRESGRVTARALAAVREAAAPGVSLRDLDEVAHAVIRDAGAKPAFLDYHPHFAPTPYPGVICASVNDAIVHGIPDGYRLRDGDLLSVDCGAYLDGWASDSAVSFTIGEASADDQRLLDTTREALEAGIAAAVVGGRLGDIAHAIGRVSRAAGYGIMEGYGGHGIGRQMHEDPSVPNEGRPGRGFKLRHGLVLALEPMLITGGRDDWHTAADGWTLRSNDGSRAAHFEHTVAITNDGPRVLTLP
ncbi:type I methionyl aminopeptidase [Streptomyces hainanensis]|uniref:Methionine aminopeptidase n=1 Tax=Streptomyces hainanensis TaxID=402648 RepID=A0A4R4TTM1_9ACTN|nr:type I methionyl aminopeptidase [Streptomyces hainanensis]TDC77459.1 type I methionyl aminopeptidase [Streptomyces hainanensis]